MRFSQGWVVDSVQRRVLLSSSKGTRSRRHEFPSVENRDEWGSHISYDACEIKILTEGGGPQIVKSGSNTKNDPGQTGSGLMHFGMKT